MKHMPSFDRPSVPPPERSPIASPDSARQERGSFKTYLGLLALGAVQACAGQADQVRGAVNRSLEHTVSVENRPDVVGMAIEVAERTRRMEDVRAETINTLADTIEQHDNPMLAHRLRLMEGARGIGRRLMTPGAHVEGISPVVRGLDQIDRIDTVQDAHTAFAGVLDSRASGELAGSTRIDLAFALTDSYENSQVDRAQTQATLRSGLFAMDYAAYTQLAREVPNAQVDLSRTFSTTDIQLFAAYVDHLNAVGYWEGRPGLTGAQVRQGRIPLSQAVALFGSVNATGGLSRWDRMSWAGARTEGQQEGAQQLNTDLSLKLAEALALFDHDVDWANGRGEGHRQVFASGDTVPVVEQRPYPAWGVTVRVNSAPPMPTYAQNGGHHGHGSHHRRHRDQ